MLILDVLDRFETSLWHTITIMYVDVLIVNFLKFFPCHCLDILVTKTISEYSICCIYYLNQNIFKPLRVNDEFQRFVLQNRSGITQKLLSILNYRIIRCIKFYLTKLLEKVFPLCFDWQSLETVRIMNKTHTIYYVALATVCLD